MQALFEALAQINGRTVSWPEFLAAVIQRQHEDDAPEVLHIIRSNSNAASESASPGAVPHEGSDTSGESDHQDAIYHSELLQVPSSPFSRLATLSKGLGSGGV